MTQITIPAARLRPTVSRPARASFIARLNDWLRVRREMAELADLDPARRDDMGLPEDPDRAFLKQLGANRYLPRDL